MNHHNFSVNLPIVFNYLYFVKKKSNHQVFMIQTIQKSKRSYFKIPCSNYPKYLNLKVSNFLIFLFSLKKGNFSLVVSPLPPRPPPFLVVGPLRKRTFLRLFSVILIATMKEREWRQGKEGNYKYIFYFKEKKTFSFFY